MGDWVNPRLPAGPAAAEVTLAGNGVGSPEGNFEHLLPEEDCHLPVPCPLPEQSRWPEKALFPEVLEK